jgi:uncharacterized membrane protein YccC
MELNRMYQTQNEMVAMEVTSQSELKKGTGYLIAGWVCFAISLLFFPILFGAVAFFMGLMTFWERSEFQGIILMGFAALGTLIGTMLSFFVAGSFFI